MAPRDQAVAGTPGTGQKPCPECGGTGRLGAASCPDCQGTGIVIAGIAGA
jgi:DnaJ-class molecular chaperone